MIDFGIHTEVLRPPGNGVVLDQVEINLAQKPGMVISYPSLNAHGPKHRGNAAPAVSLHHDMQRLFLCYPVIIQSFQLLKLIRKS